MIDIIFDWLYLISYGVSWIPLIFFSIEPISPLNQDPTCTDSFLNNHGKKESVCYNKVDDLNNIMWINMNFKIHISFPILNFQHQNLTWYQVHLVREYNFFMKTTFDGSAAEPKTSNQLNRCKTQVLVAYDRKTTLLS